MKREGEHYLLFTGLRQDVWEIIRDPEVLATAVGDLLANNLFVKCNCLFS
jgi:hypothetical protein